MLYLSKSKYCQGVQCPKMLWMFKHRKEHFDSSVLNQAILDAGNEVGDLAMGLLGDYIEVMYNDDKSNMYEQTLEFMKNGHKHIAEASFIYEGNFCAVDILKIDEDGLEIYEVKSSTEIKDIYYDDISYQLYILKNLGYTVKKALLVHIDSSYERHGSLELNKLFEIEDVSHEVFERLDHVQSTIDQLDVIVNNLDEPSIDIGLQCSKPYDCGFYGYCSKHLPSTSVFDIAGMRKDKKFELYYDNIISFEDVLQSKVKLSKNNKIQVEAYVDHIEELIDHESIRNFMKDFKLPLYFLDFETYQQVIPEFDGVKPYMQIPFQYSLHVLNKDNTLSHKEYLAEPGYDCRYELAKQLCADIPNDVVVVAYNMSFEKRVIRELSKLYPHLSDHLMAIHDHMVDLMIPFQSKWYYMNAMKGSYSIKYVLPALFPNEESLNYKNLNIVHNGSEAMSIFKTLDQLDPIKREEVRRSLLEYCKLDTYAMVKIYEKLIKI